MGWTVVSKKVERKDVPNFLRTEFGGVSHEVVDCVVRNNEAYMAVKNTETNEVHGFVVLLKLKRNETGYKEMHESEGPLYFNCPKRIIKSLSPTEDSRSIAWRFACVNKHKRLDESVYENMKRALE